MDEITTLMMVTYNRENLTKDTLNIIKENTTCPFNIVIVDNCSSDSTKNLIELFKKENENVGFIKNIYLKFNDKNNGVAIGRNQALKIASEINTDWFCTIDNDIWVPKFWLSECIDILKKNPKYGMIGVNMEGKPYDFVIENGKEFQKKPIGNLGTACLVFPKSLHKMVGYFNTEYHMYAHEDADIYTRAAILGFKMGYIKEMGKHIGEGINDQGEYRDFKNKYHKENLQKFYNNSALYRSGKKQIYIPFKE